MRQFRAIALACVAAVLAAPQPPECHSVGSLLRLRAVREASGAAMSRRTPGIIWTHNDSGEPVVVALDSTGTVRGAVRLAGVRIVDWEAVAVGPCPAGTCLYAADIGDNRASRNEVVVYRAPEPLPGDRKVSVEALRATYPDGANDAEAFFVTSDGGLFIITKGETGPIRLYRFPQPLQPGSVARLERVATLTDKKVAPKHRVTDAAASSDGRWVVVRTTGALSFYPAREVVAGRFVSALTVNLQSLREPQGEGVALADNGTVYLTGEGGGGGRPGTFVRLACTLPR